MYNLTFDYDERKQSCTKRQIEIEDLESLSLFKSLNVVFQGFSNIMNA